MKSISTLFAAMTVSVILFAQAPQKMNYQGVARDADGEILQNQNIALRLTILSGSVSGTSEYAETQSTTTNDFGLFNIQIGDGTPVSGTFVSIDWGSNSHFIKLELDATGGTNYVLMGTSQLLSVPYAFHAESTGNLSSGSVSQTLRHDGSQWVANNTLKSDGVDVWVTDNAGNTYATFDESGTQLTVNSRKLYAGRFSSDYISASTEVLKVDFTGTAGVEATAIKATSNPAIGYGYGVFGIGGKTGILGHAIGGSSSSSAKGVEGYASGSASSRFGGYFTGENDGGVTAYGVYGKGTGSSTTNYGVYGTATGGSTNWAGYFFQGNVYVNNNLGVGDITPTYPISISSSALRTININQSDAITETSHGIHVTMTKTATDLRDVNGATLSIQRNGGNGYVRGVYANASNYGNIGNIQYAIGSASYGFQNINGSSLYGAYGVFGQAQGSTTNKWGGYFVGDVYGSQFLTPSDEKLKTNLSDYSGALGKIAQLKPLAYDFDVDTYPYFNFPKQRQVGFLANDLKAQFPELVKETHQPEVLVPETDAIEMGAAYTLKDGMAKIADGVEFEAVNYLGLIPVLVAGMQEQQELIQAQQVQIDRLSKLLEEK